MPGGASWETCEEGPRIEVWGVGPLPRPHAAKGIGAVGMESESARPGHILDLGMQEWIEPFPEVEHKDALLNVGLRRKRVLQVVNESRYCCRVVLEELERNPLEQLELDRLVRMPTRATKTSCTKQKRMITKQQTINAYLIRGVSYPTGK